MLSRVEAIEADIDHLVRIRHKRPDDWDTISLNIVEKLDELSMAEDALIKLD